MNKKNNNAFYSPLLLGGQTSSINGEIPIIYSLLLGSLLKGLVVGDGVSHESELLQIIDGSFFRVLCATKSWINLLTSVSPANCANSGIGVRTGGAEENAADSGSAEEIGAGAAARSSDSSRVGHMFRGGSFSS